MSSVIYDGDFYSDIYPKDTLIKQLEEAKEELEDNDSNLIRVTIANLVIEIDTSDDSICTIV